MADPERLRMLVVGMGWPPETFLARTLSGLSLRGFEITIAGPARPRDASFRQSNFRWLTVPIRKGPGPTRLLQLIRILAEGCVRSAPGVARMAALAASEPTGGGRLARFARLVPYVGRRWDLIYFPWISAAITMRPLFDLGIPVAVSCRGSQIMIAPHHPGRAALREGMGDAFRRAAFVHCVSDDIVNEALAYGLDAARAHVIRPAINTTAFSPHNRDALQDGGPLRIITTGSLIWVKGYEFALSAIGRLRERGISVRLEIIGEGPERQRILYTMRDLSLDGSVELLGRLAPEQVRDRLRSADIFILSSVSEGISNAVLEAMACGLPVVTTDCGGMREAVDDGVEGFVIPVRDPGAMADALGRLADDPELRRRMGRSARRRAEREFDLDQQVERWARLCRRTVSEWGGGR